MLGITPLVSWKSVIRHLPPADPTLVDCVTLLLKPSIVRCKKNTQDCWQAQTAVK